jgi:hypothetical protein
MPLLISFLLRLVLVAAALAVAAALSVVFALLLCAWALRWAWARLTGRPVAPFAMRMAPGPAFDAMVRRARAPHESRTPRADAAGPQRRAPLADVTDVQPK